MTAIDERDAWHDWRDEARTATHQAPEEPPIDNYDPREDAWIADWLGGNQ